MGGIFCPASSILHLSSCIFLSPYLSPVLVAERVMSVCHLSSVGRASRSMQLSLFSVSQVWGPHQHHPVPSSLSLHLINSDIQFWTIVNGACAASRAGTGNRNLLPSVETSQPPAFGGLLNNAAGVPGRNPLTLADTCTAITLPSGAR
jgi:hypothetical protein